jgi:hypothetical protein
MAKKAKKAVPRYKFATGLFFRTRRRHSGNIAFLC